MDKRQHPLPSAAAGLAIALVVVLGACGLKPSQAPNLRVGVPSQPKQQAGTLGSPTTTLRVSVGNAVSIVPTRPAKSPVTADLGGDTPFNNDIAVDEPEVTASEPTAASSTSDAATTLPGSTTSSTPVTATVTATSTTIVANTTTPTAATSTSTATTSTSVAATTSTTVDATTTTISSTTTPSVPVSDAPTTTSTTTSTTSTTTVGVIPNSDGADGRERRASAAFAHAQFVIDGCLSSPSTCNDNRLAGAFSGAALAEVRDMVGGLVRSHLYVSIARGDGYVIDSIAVNLPDSRASVSGCFVSVRNTVDATGSILTTSMGSTREAYEMVQIDGVWTIVTHRALGAC